MKPRWIELHFQGDLIAIAIDTISWYRERRDTESYHGNCLVGLTNGGVLEVDETYGTVCRRIKGSVRI